MTEVLIYGLKQGEARDYMEELLACFKDSANTTANISRVKEAASAQGWHSFRVARYAGQAPNFAKAVTV